MKPAVAVVSTILLASTLAISPSARAHDMSAMGDMGGGAMASDMPMGAHTHMAAHMKMTPVRTATAADDERARDLLDTLRRALRPFRNYHVALARGYQIFMPTVPQDVYHFVDYPASGEEYQGHFDPARPGSLLYVRKPDGDYTLVGAMYSAPPDYTNDQLNELVPLGIARWHEHVDICLPIGYTLDNLMRGDIGANRSDVPGMIPVAASADAIAKDRELGFMADGRFGFEGTIHDAATCQSAGGHFLPLAFGWMVHVYPFNGDNLKVAYGMIVPLPLADARAN